MLTRGVQNVKPISLFFGCTMAQKPGKGNGVTFLNPIYGTSRCRTSKQMTFWNPDTKLEKIGVFVKESFEFRNLTFFT